MRSFRSKIIATCTALACSLGSAAMAQKFNWDKLGEAFCSATLAGDLAEIRPLITDGLAQAIEGAAGHPKLQPPRTMFQTYTNAVPSCSAKTINPAIVEITRGAPGGPAWREYIVIVPEADGVSRIDDVLFATRKSDTLRARLRIMAN